MHVCIQDVWVICFFIPPKTGDIDWRRYRATTVRPNDNVRLWEDELGSLVGFAWLISNGHVDLIVHPRSWCATLVPEMPVWAETR
jgi:hypothetical protein